MVDKEEGLALFLGCRDSRQQMVVELDDMALAVNLDRRASFVDYLTKFKQEYDTLLSQPDSDSHYQDTIKMV